MENRYWSELLSDVLPGRVEKPRISGLTMVIDTGLPITWVRDLLQMTAAHIDFWKFGFASASVCPPERVMDKVSLCQEYGVLAYAGGTSLEIAIAQGIWRTYLERLWANGIRVVEVSDGTIDLPLKTRREIIRAARAMGFTVLTEVGKKLPGHFLPIDEQVRMIHGDLNSGAHYIVVEGRESGTNTGVYDADGNVRDSQVRELADVLGPLSTRLIWEAPLMMQQAYYIRTFGNRVNLGNVRPADVIALESLRRGFRSDTLRAGLGLPEWDDAKNRPPGSAGTAEAHSSAGSDRPAGNDSEGGAAEDTRRGLTLWPDAGLRGPDTGLRRPRRSHG